MTRCYRSKLWNFGLRKVADQAIQRPKGRVVDRVYFRLYPSHLWLLAVLIISSPSGFARPSPHIPKHGFQVPAIKLQPHTYVVYKANEPLQIDGKLNEGAWKKTHWTTDFVDITRNPAKPPRQRTRVKLLWDKKYFYIGIQVNERNIWATLSKHDAPLYVQNACEIFIDPDGDTQNYLEFGLNALGATYDLLLTRPYRDGGHPVKAFNIRGLKIGISNDGTINNPRDRDTGWTAEIAIPMEALRQLNLLGAQAMPKAGDQWRVQFARVERRLTVLNRRYTLKRVPGTNRPLPASYSSWSPEGLVDLHYPEMWGFVQFSNTVVGSATDTFHWHGYESVKMLLRKVYYRERQYYSEHGFYTKNYSSLNWMKAYAKSSRILPDIRATKWTFLATYPGVKKETIWLINQNGKIWRDKP